VECALSTAAGKLRVFILINFMIDQILSLNYIKPYDQHKSRFHLMMRNNFFICLALCVMWWMDHLSG